jgi:chromosome segregation ATPase
MSVLYGTTPGRPADQAGGSRSTRVSPQVAASQTPLVTREGIQEQLAALRAKLVLKQNVAQNRAAEEDRLLAEFAERLAKIRNAQKSADSIRAEIAQYEAALAAMNVPLPVVPAPVQPSGLPAPAAPRKRKTLQERISEMESTLNFNKEQLSKRQEDRTALEAKQASGATLTKKEADKLDNARKQIPMYDERVKANEADLTKLRGGQ